MLPRQPLHEHLEDWGGGAVAGVPADAKRLARKAFEQPLDISGADIDLLDIAVAAGPLARSRAPADRLDLLAEDRTALQQQLEAVIIGGVVAAGDLQPAVDVEIMSCEIEHGRRTHADLHH